jgi:hypothetical protein
MCRIAISVSNAKNAFITFRQEIISNPAFDGNQEKTNPSALYKR